MEELTPKQTKLLRKILKKHPKTLDLRVASNLDDKRAAYLFQRGTELETICLDGCSLLTDDSLKFLLSHCHKLRNVSLCEVPISQGLLRELRKRVIVNLNPEYDIQKLCIDVKRLLRVERSPRLEVESFRAIIIDPPVSIA